VIERPADLIEEVETQARVRRRAEEDVACACGCERATVHPGSCVSDLKAVTAVRSQTDPVDVPVCAPCAAEVMTLQL
jgi:hypothetical protein